MRLSELFRDTVHERIGEDVDVVSLAYDSRKVRPDSLFAALPGAEFDGHDFVDDAVARGAVAVLCERTVGHPTEVRVKNSRKALAQAARVFSGAPDSTLKAVGITGTNGKTTVSVLVKAIFEHAGARTAALGTLGLMEGHRTTQTSLTTPESVDLMEMLAQLRDAGTDVLVMEVSSHALDQYRVGGVCYDAAVFTNLSRDHLDYHPTMDAYFNAKAKLFRERLKPGGISVLNLDDPWGRRLTGELSSNVWTYSDRSDAATIHPVELTVDGRGIAIVVDFRGERLSVRSELIGSFNVSNLLAAIAVGLALELPHSAIKDGLESITSIDGRFERLGGGDAPLVVVDYAHTPDALTKALETLRPLTRGALICVVGCGGDRDPGKRPQMGQAAGGADYVFVTNDNPRTEDPKAIASAICVGLEATGTPYEMVLNRRDAIHQAITKASSGDVVLVAGKGHEDYQLIGNERIDFDDRKVARAALRGW